MTAKRIWMLGTSPDGQGGIASVIDQYRTAGFFSSDLIRFENTHHDRSASGRVLPFVHCAAKLWPALLMRKVSLVHAQTSYGGSFWRKLILVLPAIFLGVPVVTHLHAGSFIEFHAKGGVWRRYWMRFLFRHSSRVIVLSDEWNDWVSSVEPLSRVAVIPNSLATSTGADSACNFSNRPTVLFLGRVGDGKGTFDLLHAFASVLRRVPTARLVIGGDGDIDRLFREVQALGLESSVEYVGWANRETKARLLSETWLLALPSYKEGLPMGILEAMAYSRAVVSCPVGGVASAVSEGKTGFLVQPGDVQNLSLRLEEILSSEKLARELGEAARKVFEQKFSHETVLPRILEIYRSAGVSAMPQLQKTGTNKPNLPRKTTSRFARLTWLSRRLSRIYPAEIPYRIGGVIRGAFQKHGLLDARHVPTKSIDARFGSAWVKVPEAPHVFKEAVVAEADRIRHEGFRIFDIDISVERGKIDWNVDPKTGHRIDLAFGLSIDFRHVAAGVDIKYLWELNRHLWWVPIAQAYAVTGKQEYLDALSHHIDDWLSSCPYPLGPNWSSPVEHGIRLINWSIVWHLIGGNESPIFQTEAGTVLRERWLASIYQHMRFAHDNYSFYSSSDNHLIGEAAGIYVASRTWDLWDKTRVLGKKAKSILEEEMLKQYAEDGVNLEQAFCYHKFSLEFLVAALLCGDATGDRFSPRFRSRLHAAIRYMAAMTDCAGHVPAIGDSDDGKVFAFAGDGSHSAYEAMLRFGAAYFRAPELEEKCNRLKLSEAAGLWLCIDIKDSTGLDMCSSAAKLPDQFRSGGYLLFGKHLHTPQELRAVLDIGPLGYNRIAGHGHADALALLLSAGGNEFLIDPGTYCYNAAPELRHYFRGTAAHNTVTIDDVDQSIYGGSFLWLRDIQTTLEKFEDDGNVLVAEASHDGYLRLKDPVRHIRKVTMHRGSQEFVVEDRFVCAEVHDCRLHWHFSPSCTIEWNERQWTAKNRDHAMAISIEFRGAEARLVRGQESPPLGWISCGFYEKQPTQTISVAGSITPESRIVTRFSLSSIVD